MKIINGIIGLLLLIGIAPNLFAQSEVNLCTINEKQMTCYTLNSGTLWKELIKEIESMEEFESNADLQFEWVRCHYGLAGVYMSEYDTENGSKVVAEGIKMNSKLLKQDENNADYHSMMSGLYGLQIGFAPMKGMTLGSKSDRHVRKALKIDETNGFAWLQQGSSYFHTPSFFGGDMEEAVKSYEQAVILTRDENDFDTNWMWLEAMTWLGQAYAKNDQLDEAEKTYLAALKVFHDFAWIKNSLLPSLQTKMK